MIRMTSSGGRELKQAGGEGLILILVVSGSGECESEDEEERISAPPRGVRAIRSNQKIGNQS